MGVRTDRPEFILSHGLVFIYSLGAMDEREGVCVSGEGESPLGRAAWGGPRAWRAREGLRGAWIEKAQSGLALRGSALGLARDKTYYCSTPQR